MTSLSLPAYSEGTVSVTVGFYNKVPQTGWLKQQIVVSHSSGGWKVQDQGVS